MTTFTTTTKNKLSWQAPEIAPVSVATDVYLKIDDTHYFLIADNQKLIITPGNVGILWAGESKNRLAWTATPATIDNTELLISDTHRLLIADGYSLVIDPANSGTQWEPITKTR